VLLAKGIDLLAASGSVSTTLSSKRGYAGFSWIA
jgi:hypothetical protein